MTHLTTLLRRVARTVRHLIGLLGIVGILLDGRGDLLHGRAGFFQAGSLFLRARGELFRSGRQSLRRIRHVVGGVTNLAERCPNGFGGSIQRGSHLSHFVCRFQIQSGRQISFRHLLQYADRLQQWFRHKLRDEVAHGDTEDDRSTQLTKQHGSRPGIDHSGIVVGLLCPFFFGFHHILEAGVEFIAYRLHFVHDVEGFGILSRNREGDKLIDLPLIFLELLSALGESLLCPPR